MFSAFAPRKIPSTHFCLRLSRPHGHIAAGSIRLNEKSSNLIANRTCNLAACSIVLRPTTLPRAPSYILSYSDTAAVSSVIATDCNRLCNITVNTISKRSLPIALKFTSHILKFLSIAGESHHTQIQRILPRSATVIQFDDHDVNIHFVASFMMYSWHLL
jgi:hypothetical protein